MRELLLIAVILACLNPISGKADIGENGTGEINGYQIGPKADLSYAKLQGANLSGADLSDANLTRADLVGEIGRAHV